MSADRWSVCPNCQAELNMLIQTERQVLEDSYGKIPQAEWLELSIEINSKKYDIEETMREDYEIEIDEDAIFHVEYSASCQNCDFRFRFEKNVNCLNG